MDVLFYQKADSDAAIKVVEFLAREIWPEHYIPIIGKPQVDYMLNNFQSAAAIKDQTKEGQDYYLIMYGRIPIGYLSCKFELDTHSLFLSKFYLLSLYRGQGFGRQALGFVEKVALQKAVQKVVLMVSKKNSSAISFYEHCGFMKVGPIVKDIGGGFAMDDFMFEKIIKHK
jgi:GNAT superfamily N-acetyltransferase